MTPSQLRRGIIIHIAALAGVELKRVDRKCAIRCPFHDDRVASAFLDPNTNCFGCAVCTPGGGWSAKRFAEALGVPWPIESGFGASGREVPHGAPVSTGAFTASDARRTWDLALARARDDDRAGDDLAVYGYIHSRGLAEAWEDGLFGVLSDDMPLPTAIRSWAGSGHRLLGALYDHAGQVANVQSRSVTGSTPKTLFPSGSKASGTVFANTSGIEVLRGSWQGSTQVIYAEGMTDFLALASISPVPVLSAPGTSMAASGIGPWIEGYEVFIALDWDEAGQAALGPTAERAYAFGADRVHRIEWPRGCKDACDLVEQVSLVGLADFLDRALARTAS